MGQAGGPGGDDDRYLRCMPSAAEPVTTPSPDPDEALPTGPWSWATPARLVVLGLALMFLAGVVGYRIGLPDRPGAGSADVGFLQDMIAHHKQAVTMSFRTAEAATDPVVRSFAKEIIALQEYEIGLMDAWLDEWGHTRDSGGPTAMTWAGHSHPRESMPGMATEEELDALHAAEGLDIDDRFLRLMIAHHVGGVDMAEVYLERGDDADVRQLAERIVKTQKIEISEMQFARRRLGLPVDGSSPAPPPAPSTTTTGRHH